MVQYVNVNGVESDGKLDGCVEVDRAVGMSFAADDSTVDGSNAVDSSIERFARDVGLSVGQKEAKGVDAEGHYI